VSIVPWGYNIVNNWKVQIMTKPTSLILVDLEENTNLAIKQFIQIS
jgi:hypothetical protein